MKMAKASKDDIRSCAKFFEFLEEFMEYRTYTPEDDEHEETSVELTDEEFMGKLRELWSGRSAGHAVDTSWRRVVWGCDLLIDNVCDPNEDTLEWKPDLKAKLAAS